MTPKEKDAARGVLWEKKWRGRLEEYPGWETLSFCKWMDYKAPKPVKVSWKISRVGLGTYQWKYNPKIIERAIELGVGIIDSAEGYGFGKVEKELGKVFGRFPHRKFWVASKVARNHMFPKAVLSAARRSRDNLQVDSLDLYQIHWPVFPLGGILESFARLREEGTIHRLGACNFCAGQLATLVLEARKLGLEVESLQTRFNSRDSSASLHLIPFAKSLGIKVIAYSPLAQGFLPGSFLNWGLENGADYVIPATNSLEHLKRNLRWNKKALGGFRGL